MSISIWDYEKPLDAMMLSHDDMAALVLKHEQQIKDIAAHLLELKQLVTPMMEFKTPTKVFGPNLKQVLNAAGFYRKKEWVGLTDKDKKEIKETVTYNQFDTAGEYANRVQAATEAKLKEKNGG